MTFQTPVAVSAIVNPGNDEGDKNNSGARDCY
jgi:hypothetical protein